MAGCVEDFRYEILQELKMAGCECALRTSLYDQLSESRIESNREHSAQMLEPALTDL